MASRKLAMSLPDEEPYLDSYCARGEKETPQSCDLHGALHSSIREDDGPGYCCCRFLIEEKQIRNHSSEST